MADFCDIFLNVGVRKVKAAWWGCQGRPHSWSLGFFHISVSVEICLQTQASRHTRWHSLETTKRLDHMWSVFRQNFPITVRVTRTTTITKNKHRWASLITSQLAVFIWRAIWLWRFYQCPCVFSQKIVVCCSRRAPQWWILSFSYRSTWERKHWAAI